MIFANDCYVNFNCKKYKDGVCKLCKDEYCPRLFRVNELFNNSQLSQFQRKHISLFPDADGTDDEEFSRLKTIQDNILQFVNEGHNLYLFSEKPGNGKSSWSYRFIQSYIYKIWSKTIDCKALFVNVPRFLMEMKQSISNPTQYFTYVKEHILDCDLVVFDDIGTKVGTDFELENLLYYINTRIDSNKANIYTSNIRPENLSQVVGSRLASRVANASTVIELKGQDKRCFRA